MAAPRDIQLALENSRTAQVLTDNLCRLYELVYDPKKAEDSKRKITEWRSSRSKSTVAAG